jgi:fimbrial isopeptide formation D2 family protein
MKKRKLLTLALALVFAVSFMAPAAVASGGPYTLEINGYVYGYHFEVYKIFDVNQANEYTALSSNPFATFTPTTGQPGHGWAAPLVTYVGGLTPNSDALHDLMVDLSAFIHAPNAVPRVGAIHPGTATGVDFGSISDPGYYFIAAYNHATDRTPANFAAGESFLLTLNDITTTGNNLTITPKIEIPTVDKIISSPGGPEWANAGIGDTINFQLTVTVPDLSSFSAMSGFNYTLNVHDTLSAGLTLVPGVTVTGPGATSLTQGADPTGQYTLPAPGAPPSLTVSFNSEYILSLDPGNQITITYSATLNELAVMAPNNNPNSVVLEYSNDPHDDSSTAHTEPEVTRVYTFEFDIFKFETLTHVCCTPASGCTDHGASADCCEVIGANCDRTALSGATFQLYATDPSIGTPTPLSFTTASSGSDVLPNVYKHDTGVTPNISTPASGLISLQGLDAGTYWLVETVAPTGFVLPTAPFQVVIAHPLGDGVYTVNGSSSHQVDVENNRGNLFPETGGMGRTILYVTGGVLMGGALLALVFRKRFVK